MLMFTLFLQVMGTDWLWLTLPFKAGCGLYAQYRCGVGFLFLSIGAVPGRFVVRSKLKRVLNEAVKSNVTARELEVQMFPGWYIDFVKSPHGRVRAIFLRDT